MRPAWQVRVTHMQSLFYFPSCWLRPLEWEWILTRTGEVLTIIGRLPEAVKQMTGVDISKVCCSDVVNFSEHALRLVNGLNTLGWIW